MGRKVVWAMAFVVVAVASAGLVGGQVGGFLWWGTHEPIYIYGDDDFTYSNGVMSGSGTAADPYIIEGWSITPEHADYGIYVDHTRSCFVIRDCVIEGARIAGVYFSAVANGRIDKVQIARSDTAIYLLDSMENRIGESVISDCAYGVVMAARSQENVISGNSFVDNGIAGYDPQGWNTWYDGKTGNYWSDYRGADGNKDGIGDEPYYPLGDLHPLMESPVELTGVSPAGPSYAGNLVAPDGSLVVTSQTPITLAATDPGSGLAEIKYSIDSGEWVTYASPILLKGDDGPRKIAYYGIDKLGNVEPKKTVSFLLDNHAPQTAMDVGDPKYVDSRGTWITSSSKIALRRTQESTYGRAETYYRINDGAWLKYTMPFRITGEDGARSVSFYSRNASGVVESVQTRILLKDDTPPASRGAKAAAPTGTSTGAAAPSTTTASTGSAPSTTTVTVVPVTTTPTAPSTQTQPSATPAASAPAPVTSTPAASSTASGGKDGTAQAQLSGAALGQTGATGTPTSQTESAVTPSTVTPPSVSAPAKTQTPSGTPD